MKATQEKAQALTGAAGAQVGCVLNIEDNTGSSYYGGWRGGRYQHALTGAMDSRLRHSGVTLRAQLSSCPSVVSGQSCDDGKYAPTG